MKPLRRVSPLRTLVLLCALLQISQAECHQKCDCNETETLTATTTTVTFGSRPNCSLSNDSTTYVNGSIAGLTPGSVYQIYVKCLNCCKTVTTEPEAVRNLSVTNITTSSVSLIWTKPEGNSSSFRVHWTNGYENGTENTNEEHETITNLAAGVRYNVSVTAVADDNQTEGKEVTVSQFTKPGTIGEHTVVAYTDTISLNWTAPPGQVFKYRVEWNMGEAQKSYYTYDPFITLSDLIGGTTYTITVTAVAGDNQTGEPYTFTSITKPAAVRDLNITNVTTSSVSLNWTKPTGNANSYTVQWTRRDATLNNTTAETSFTINSLIPGSQYNITVAAVAGNPFKEGTRTSKTTFTRPTKPESIKIDKHGIDNLSINWILPDGNVDSYVANISNTDLNYFHTIITGDLMANFTGLSPGRIFNITVTAKAGNFKNTSDQSSFATVPTPPGPIIVSETTNSSLHLMWATPALMDSAPFINYYITYAPQDVKENVISETINVSSIELSQLSSGTNYSITLKTTGPQNKRSTVVQKFVFTKPNPVRNLAASPKSTTSVEVTWSDPKGAQSYYQYLVQTYSATGELFNLTVSNNSIEVLKLRPGTRYSINVTTIAAPGSESTVEQTVSYTKPEVVTNLTVEDKTTTTIRLTWQRLGDYERSYLVRAQKDGVVVQTDSTETETYTFSNLGPGEQYTFDVITVVEGVESAKESISCYTKPAAVSNITVIGTTTNLSVSWTPATGQVISYTVQLYRDRQIVEDRENLPNNTSNALFVNVTPGVLYCVVVVTRNGPGDSSKSEVCNATFPNPPGPIMVESQTVDSINFTWPLPANMDRYHYNFSVSSFNVSFLTENSWHLLDSLQSGSRYNISVITIGVWNYESTAVTAENYTRPYAVTNLRQTAFTTNVITLVWEQQESKYDYSYLVQASNGSIFRSITVSNTTDTITGLVPGTNYSFTVTTQTADGTQAAPATVSLFTRPGTVQPSITSQGSNSSILVSWTKPPGKVEYYVVRLKNISTSPREEQVINTTETSWLFENLSAGKQYSAMVTTHSGPISASSGFVINATFPNAPGPIEVLKKTNSSITIRWEEAPLMTSASFQYRVTITPPHGAAPILTSKTSHTFITLLSGTSYTISVRTIGTMGFESHEVQIPTVTTRPFSVKYLSTTTEEESIAVMWDKPDEYMESYRYNVTWRSSDEFKSFINTGIKYNIEKLVPGSHYDITVTTETSDGTQGTPIWISNCTNASPVKSLQCVGPNKTNAELILSWPSPKGRHTGFQVTVNDSKIVACCNHTASNLRHHTMYNLSVETLSCGQPSTPVSRMCWTGITNPAIPQDGISLVPVTKTHNTFSLQVDSALLNDANGPVTYVGVLLSNNLPGDTSNWRAYLGNTYDKWKAHNVTVYLTTVKENSIQSRSGESGLTIEIGDGTKWEGYSNGALVAGGTYQFAVVVFTSLSLQNNLVNGEMSLVSITNFYTVVLSRDPAVIGITVGATLGIFCCLFFILIGFIIYWKRLSNKETSDIQIHSIGAKVSVAVRMEDYEDYYRKQKADSNCGFAEEFEDLKVVGTAQSKTNALTLDNKPKNRYNNVLPYDSSRVKLSIIHGSPYDDYINANYIPGYNSRKEFIAAQGPLPATVKDFWRMIWEKNVQTLVMLTRCNEQGRVKCEQYWESGTKHFENITVTTTSEIPLEDWTIRDFDIKNVKTAETRTVRHFHYTAWPDHGVPETTELLISFRHLVREHMDQYSKNSPTVVHCSAGVGRTGTFIAIDRLIFQIERDNIVDVYGIVHDLRMHRPLMVQTEDQYVYLNQCAMDIIRSRTGTNVDLIYQNTAALSIYENVQPKKGFHKNGYHNA